MVYWSVARPSRTPGDVLVRSGYVHGDDAAIAQIIDAGTQLVTEPEGAQPMIWVTLGASNALVDGFSDPEVPRDELIAEIHRRIAEEEARQRAAPATPRVPPPRSTTSTATTTVHDQWHRISDWLGSHVPGMVITGADRDAIDAAMMATGRPWPADLVEFFGHVNGIPAEPWMSLLPRHEFLSLDRVVEQRATMIRICREGAEMYGYDPGPVTADAGAPAGTFIPAFVPFAGLDGNYLCVDTRPGPLSGCVVEFDKSGADDAGPRWASITDLLTELADSLTIGGDFDEGWHPVASAGTVEWDWDRTWRVRQIVLGHFR